MKINWKKYADNITSRVQLAKNVYYEVVWTEGFKDSHTVGETRFNPNQIVIKTGQTSKETTKTYLHEILHAISETYEIGLTETQVQKLEKALHYVLKPGNLFKE